MQSPYSSSQNYSQRIILGGLVIAVFILLIYPWLLLVTFIGFSSGYLFIHYFDSYSETVEKFVERLSGVKLSGKRKARNYGGRVKLSPSSLELSDSDPLSSQMQNKDKPDSSSKKKATNPKIEDSNPSFLTTPRKSKLHLLPPDVHSAEASPAAFVPTPYQKPNIDDLNLKMDPRLDASISKFLTSVFDYYVGPEWAPYLTRKQLKLTFKQLLTNLGERINARLVQNPDFVVDLTKTKLIPLVLDFVIKIESHYGGVDGADMIFPLEKQVKTRVRVRRLCRMIFLNCMENEEERKCKLWLELGIAVLSDGVFWNIFLLGRDQIPELFDSLAKQYLEIIKNRENRKSPVGNTDEETEAKMKPVTFLLDNFLDRKDSLEQADPIVSRWRPTLKEIIEETELLYPLIQYLKHVGGQKALAYLQAVLDDAPEAKDHCRRVLEIEYLPGFCRSNFFHESMGLSRVEQGTEVITDGSPGSRRSKGHTRSASYGSKNNQGFSDILRMEGVVDGLPLYCDTDFAGPSSHSSITSGFGSSGALSSDLTETDSIFRKKPQLADIVAKFFKSTVHHKYHSSDPSVKSLENSPKRSMTSRVGIDGKSYQDLNDSDVIKRVKVKEDLCDILQTTADIVTSLVTINSWLGPVLSSWLTFLDPYIKPHFNHKLDQVLKEFLTLDLFITSVDLITDAFNSSSVEEETHKSNPDIPVYNSAYGYKNDSTRSDSTNANSSASPSQNQVALKQLMTSLLSLFITNVIDVEKFIVSLSLNRDYIFLFFVDMLDLLVFELFGDCCDTETE